MLFIPARINITIIIFFFAFINRLTCKIVHSSVVKIAFIACVTLFYISKNVCAIQKQLSFPGIPNNIMLKLLPYVYIMQVRSQQLHAQLQVDYSVIYLQPGNHPTCEAQRAPVTL